jgi:LacI family transcriptional regulator
MALGWYDYRLHRGIEKYAQEQSWHLYSNLARERVLPWGWDGDGILAWLGAGDDLAEFVMKAGKPTVDLSYRRPQLNFPRVLEDHAHAAQLVAEHFLSRGFSHFAYYSDNDNWSYEERGEGFLKALRSAGHECEWLRWHRSPEYSVGQDQWRRKRSWVLAQLKKVVKPLALFAANDDQAMDVLDACMAAGISVPEEVAIIGAENYLLAANSMRIPISSVDTNLEALGYQASALLDDLMKGRRPPKDPVRIPAAGIVTRMSSDLLAVTHKGVANSLRFIWQHYHEPIQVSDLVDTAFMSRRGLHKAFLQQVGRTPGQELQRVRIERAKRLLAETNHKIEVIASMCGYQSANSLNVAFKRATRLSPKQYRDKLPKQD